MASDCSVPAVGRRRLDAPVSSWGAPPRANTWAICRSASPQTDRVLAQHAHGDLGVGLDHVPEHLAADDDEVPLLDHFRRPPTGAAAPGWPSRRRNRPSPASARTVSPSFTFFLMATLPDWMMYMSSPSSPSWKRTWPVLEVGQELGERVLVGGHLGNLGRECSRIRPRGGHGARHGPRRRLQVLGKRHVAGECPASGPHGTGSSGRSRTGARSGRSADRLEHLRISMKNSSKPDQSRYMRYFMFVS